MYFLDQSIQKNFLFSFEKGSTGDNCAQWADSVQIPLPGCRPLHQPQVSMLVASCCPRFCLAMCDITYCWFKDARFNEFTVVHNGCFSTTYFCCQLNLLIHCFNRCMHARLLNLQYGCHWWFKEYQKLDIVRKLMQPVVQCVNWLIC